MKTSFAKPATATPEVVAEPEVVIPQNENAAVASPEKVDHDDVTTLGFPHKPVEGEITGDDIVIPRFHQVQSVGPLSEKFAPGSLVYNKEVVVSDGNTPVNLTVLRIKKRYIEHVEYGGDDIVRVFDTLEEVKAAGGWIEWRDNERPPFSPMLQTLILIQSPFEDHPLFPYQLGDHSYGLALWTLRSTAFTRAGKAIITASQFALRDGLHRGGWQLTSKREKIGMNFVYVPVLRHDAKHSDEFAQFALGLVS
jgi:hypothetical protein